MLAIDTSGRADYSVSKILLANNAVTCQKNLLRHWITIFLTREIYFKTSIPVGIEIYTTNLS